MTHTMPLDLIKRDPFEIEMARTTIPKIASELEKVTDPEDAVYFYMLIQDFYQLAELVVPSFDELAPLVKIAPSVFDEIKPRAVARKAALAKESDREIGMMLAKKRVDTAIAQFGQDSQQARMAMAKAIQFLPDDIKADLDAKAREMGLMPPASGYTTDGQPVFTVDALASHFGMDPEEVMRDVGEYGMTVDASTIHLPQ